jgi:hypothetical protein
MDTQDETNQSDRAIDLDKRLPFSRYLAESPPNDQHSSALGMLDAKSPTESDKLPVSLGGYLPEFPVPFPNW